MSLRGDEEKSSLKRLHKTEVVQEARAAVRPFLGRRETNRQVCLTNALEFGSSFWNRYKLLAFAVLAREGL